MASVRTPAHPHSRGENLDNDDGGRLDLGSSPLTRGKHFLCAVLRAHPRLIPTHAGKTRGEVAEGRLHAAHPHSRGENTSPMPRLKFDVGSSPLTRGKRDELSNGLVVFGLIPTHAGKTCRCRAWRWRSAAHPHSRGENRVQRMKSVAASGSSPLTRGKPRARRPRVAARRLIPTHAGKTSCCPASSNADGAHPHSRGENCSPSPTPTQATGSSPLTRGKRQTRDLLSVQRRLIPTHAGKTLRHAKCAP